MIKKINEFKIESKWIEIEDLKFYYKKIVAAIISTKKILKDDSKIKINKYDKTSVGMTLKNHKLNSIFIEFRAKARIVIRAGVKSKEENQASKIRKGNKSGNTNKNNNSNKRVIAYKDNVRYVFESLLEFQDLTGHGRNTLLAIAEGRRRNTTAYKFEITDKRNIHNDMITIWEHAVNRGQMLFADIMKRYNFEEKTLNQMILRKKNFHGYIFSRSDSYVPKSYDIRTLSMPVFVTNEDGDKKEYLNLCEASEAMNISTKTAADCIRKDRKSGRPDGKRRFKIEISRKSNFYIIERREKENNQVDEKRNRYIF